MSDAVFVVRLQDVQAHLAKQAIAMCEGNIPAHLSHALEDFRRHFPIRSAVKGNRCMGLVHVASSLSLELAMFNAMNQVPEIIAWSGRSIAPLDLDALAKATTESYWKEHQSVTTYVGERFTPTTFWRRFFAALRAA